MNLIIDIGNSFIKAAVFEADHLVRQEQFLPGELKVLESVFSDFPFLKNGILSVVGRPEKKMSDLLMSKLDKLILLDENTSVPVANKYETGETLGKDRLAAVVGANYLFPGKNILVLDAGTAITYDFITSEGQYEGGSISPGLYMRFKALHEFTNNLPLLEPHDEFTFPAKTTDNAIITGVQLGMIKEIEGIIHLHEKQYPQLKIVLTGGDAIFFDKNLKNSIFVDLNLVQRGLNRILTYDAENK
jgi:type III pantothenate kinase